MTELCLEHYRIDTIDIWEYERALYLNGKTSDEKISQLKNRLEQIIVYTNDWQNKADSLVTVQPFTDVKRYDSGEHQGYFDRHLNDLINSKSLRESVALNYFMVKNEMFSFIQKIFINPNHENFDYWFCLKLSQYSEGLKYINDFLNTILHEMFQKDCIYFFSFLEVSLMQFEDLLSTKVVKYVNIWIDGKKKQIDFMEDGKTKTIWEHSTFTDETLFSGSEDFEFDLDLDSIGLPNDTSHGDYNPLAGEVRRREFDLTKKDDEIEGVQIDSEIRENVYTRHNSFYSPIIKSSRDSDKSLQKLVQIFDEVFSSLDNEGFLSKDENSPMQLLDIFSKKSIAKNNHIKWKGTAYELRVFVELIEKSQLCEHIGGLHKWKVVQKCFQCKLRGIPEGPIRDYKSISQSKATKQDKSEKLARIVNRLIQLDL